MSNKKHMYKRGNKKDEVKSITNKLIDERLPNRKGKQNPTYIVIHEVSLGTGKSPEDYNMQRYANKIIQDAENTIVEITNEKSQEKKETKMSYYDLDKKYDKELIEKAKNNIVHIKDENGEDVEMKIKVCTIGYHYLVGDKEIYQFIEDDVATSHTGTAFGNNNSIGVERLICKGVNYEQATHNQAKLIATLMLKHDISIENVITHKEMQRRYGNPEQKENPKQCPGRMLAGFRGTVQDFKKEIKRCIAYGWLFEDELDLETRKKLPDIQRKALKDLLSKKGAKKIGINEMVYSVLKNEDKLTNRKLEESKKILENKFGKSENERIKE